MKKVLLFAISLLFVAGISSCNQPAAADSESNVTHEHTHEHEGANHDHEHEHDGDTTDHEH